MEGHGRASVNPAVDTKVPLALENTGVSFGEARFEELAIFQKS